MKTRHNKMTFDNHIKLKEISQSLAHLSTSPESLPFVYEMMYLSELLNRIEESADRASQAIEVNIRDPSYFIAAYFDTYDLDISLSIYKAIRSLTRHVLFYDKFCEVGDVKCATLANQALASALAIGRFAGGKDDFSLAVGNGLTQFSQYWNFEQETKRRMLQCHYFSYPELKNFLMSKSSDAPLVYAKVLEINLPTFNSNVSKVLHYNQALLDMLDDWEDIEEDLHQDMPNIFVLMALAYLPYDELKKFGENAVRQITYKAFSIPRCNISRLVSALHASIKDTSVPRHFAFLKCLSDRYVNTLREQLALTDC